MTMPSIPSGDGGSNKSFWKNPENCTQTILLCLAGGAVLWFWGMIVHFLLMAAVDTLHLIFVGGTIVIILAVLTSKRIHAFARVINRWITSWFASLDPIGIREDQISETKKRKSKADDAIGSVRGLREGLARRMMSNQSEYAGSIRRLKAAQSIQISATASEENKHQAQRTLLTDSKYSDSLEQLLKTQQIQLTHYDEAITRLTRLGELCDDFITRKEQEIRLEKDNQAEARGLRTVRQSMSAIFGKDNGVGQQMDDMAREQLEEEYNAEIGAFDQFLDQTKNILAKADFNDLASLQQVQERIDNSNATVPAAKQITGAPAALSAPRQKTAVEDYFK